MVCCRGVGGGEGRGVIGCSGGEGLLEWKVLGVLEGGKGGGARAVGW